MPWKLSSSPREDGPRTSKVRANLIREPSFDREASATNSISFLGLSPSKACKTVCFFVSFHRGAAEPGILFLVSIERGTSRRAYRRRPWLSDVSPLGVLPVGSLPALAVARVGVVGPKRASFDSAAHNPDIGGSDPRNRRFPDTSRFCESEDDTRRSTVSGSSGTSPSRRGHPQRHQLSHRSDRDRLERPRSGRCQARGALTESTPPHETATIGCGAPIRAARGGRR
jgi:hypothetical protein